MSARTRRVVAIRIRLALSALASLAGAAILSGYAFYDDVDKWPDGDIVLQEQLGNTPTALIDGNATWNDAFEGAMATWNNYLGPVKFVGIRDSTAPIGDGNGYNNVVFAGDIFGKPFSDTGFVVVTNWYRVSTGQRTEADVIFNNKWQWNSYRGARRSGVYDFSRIALHQLGHVLGAMHED